MDKNEELQKWLNDDRYVQIKELALIFQMSPRGVESFLRRNKIKSIKKIHTADNNNFAFYEKNKCESARLLQLQNPELQKYLNDDRYVQIKELHILWGTKTEATRSLLKTKNIKHIKAFYMGTGKAWSFYDRAECERARPFINKPEQKEVEQVEEKQMELPEPKEQTPDIIPADTIDLFTMSELEAELKKRGVELTADVRAKINASDMPEMRHIATMLRGNTKTIAIRLSVLNEIAGQLKSAKKETKQDSQSKDDIFKLMEAWERANKIYNRPCATWEAMQYLSFDLQENVKRRTAAHEACILSGDLIGNHKDGFKCANIIFENKKEPPTPVATESNKEEKENLRTMQLTTEQKKVFCIIKEMTSIGSVDIRQSAVAKKLSSKYNIGYNGARVAVSRAVKKMEIKGYVLRPSFGVVLIRAEYIGADIVETRFAPKIEAKKQPIGIKPKYKLDLIMSRLEEISLLRKEIAELKQMMVGNK